MISHPLPRSARRAPLVVAATAVTVLAAPSLVHGVLPGSEPAPGWVFGTGSASQAVLLAMQLRLFTAHRSGRSATFLLDWLAACCGAAAVVLALVPGLLAGGVSPLGLVCASTALAGTAVAVGSLVAGGAARDRRAPWLAAASALSVVNVAVQLLGPVVPVLGSDLLAVAAVAACAVVLVGFVLTPAPERVVLTPVRWSHLLLSVHGIGGMGVAALLVPALRSPAGSPAAAVLAVTSLAAVGAGLVVLTHRTTALQGAHEASLVDGLTGEGNRRALVLRLEEVCAAPRPVALLVLDLDRFRNVNDGLGHQAGDELLRQVAGRLRGLLPPGALLARTGGDEFAVLLVDAGAEDAPAFAWTLNHSLAAVPFEVRGRSLHASASTGLALHHPGPGVVGRRQAAAAARLAADDLLRRADTAVHAAKAGGAGPVLHDAHLDRRAREALETGEELRRAFAHGELVLHYQPQVDVVSGRLRGVEALVRWQHPERGLLSPDAFLRVAEEVGLGHELTALVLDQAVSQAAAWSRAGLPVPVSVNLTAADVGPDLVERASRLLLDSGLPPALLVQEITETVLVVDPEGAAAVLRDLVALGVEISIDDFGTGYSSLTLLLQLPVAEVRIDRSFVSELRRDVGSSAVVRTTVDLAHSLGMRVVAEGVEDDGVLTELGRLGCDVSQGYLHAHPLPAAEATAWMRDRAATPAPPTLRG
ncbi:bifunctional diguanylate cyclase/phosphodiesterase [Quadrisphaera sp. INWT6]|uniref:putative bifunctional diguanylate cyclase/phosphodiesterase n=1 Tax=Quadrisphaera sp. INWT6 TaxID=2596917 RepID=UPI0018925973|nr:bifunctional diguanylate cyclase/phosphodiesterase [Quadrisphaera sp. INWT6]MBF5082038.1 bifunctional diguanylate cyclase/phosphodiesterase [Quadrisphaera sp. INWT6]